MNDDSEQRLTREEASRHFAVAFNRFAWRLLDTRYRSEEETQRMIHAAHASYMHWLEAGSAVNWQRGAWLLSRIYAEVGNGPLALVYANECRALHDANVAEMSDFDTVYSIEAEARAQAILGNHGQALELLNQARAAAQLIGNDQDRDFVLNDLDAGNWGELVLRR